MASALHPPTTGPGPRLKGRVQRIWQDGIGWFDSHTRIVLAAILLLALVFGAYRFIQLEVYAESNTANALPPLVWNLAHGNGYVACYPRYFPFCSATNNATAAREPVPSLLFAATAFLTRESVTAAYLTGVVINLLILCGVFALCRALANERVALLASLLWALYVPALDLVREMSGDLLAALGVVWGIFFLIRAQETNAGRAWLAAGICLALGALSRSAVSVLVPVLSIGLLVAPASNPSRSLRGILERARPVLFFVGAFLLVMLPWIVRNQVTFGRPVLGSTLTGYNLYRQNYMLSSDNYLRYVYTDEADRAIRALLARHTDLQGNESEAEVDAVYREEALSVIRAHPLRYLSLSAYRAVMLWLDWRVDERMGNQLSTRQVFSMLEQLLLLSAAIVGLIATWRRSWVLGVCLIAYSLLHMAVASRMVFIVPVMPLCVVLAAIGFAQLARALSKRLRAARLTMRRFDLGC